MSYWRKTIKPLLDDEIGTIHKQAPARVTLAFPNRYSVGMASLGYQVIYRLFNNVDGVACERTFLPDDPDAFEGTGEALPTVESGRDAGDCQLFAMSVSFELDLTNIIRTLDLAGIHPLREKRDDSDAIVMIGGPLTSSNPYPLTPFADVIAIGDGEQIVPVLAEALRDATSREDFYDLVDGMPGIFLPARHSHEPQWATAPKELLPAYSQIVTPHSELSNMFLVEAQRGCPRPCTFCLARTMYGPNRNNQGQELLDTIPDWVTKVGLVGAALSDFPHTKFVGRTLTDRGIKLGVSSIRADTVDAELAEILKAGGLRTFTVASDAPSERLRQWLKKGITTEDLLKTAQISRDLGFKGLKVYMMIGLGPENDDDITELISFTKELAKVNRIALGISPFVPKRHTPHFQDSFAGVKTIENRLKRIQKELRTTAELRNVSAKWAWVENVIARGGADVGMAAYAIYRNESIGAWKKALDDVGWVDPYEANESRIELPAGQIVRGDYGLHSPDDLAGRKVSSHAEGLAI
ncbi:B12-binding domain-containing radical SAM protein [Deinococcus aquiradiocola]|uniref:Radical SAM protein n=1 Tax=Deinococcus aquiradiocola TaxID=393059 RepID=A0A917PN75_9DEIO|nr:radical SAM protein [Deinococcus aquiradiocola]GGJ84697.1 radical SAM protein [Deinococcus aquiradiocola]